MPSSHAFPDSGRETIRAFRPDETGDVIALWRECGLVVPWNDPEKDIERKRAVDPDGFLVATAVSNGTIMATCMVGYDGHRGWINYLAVSPAHRRHGLGTRILEAAESRLRDLGCPKINLQVRNGNTDVLAFYESLGFRIDDVTSLGKRLESDLPPAP